MKVEFQSEKIKSIAYDVELKSLEVEFNDGSINKYINVDESFYNDFLRDNDKWAYFNDKISGNFEVEEIFESKDRDPLSFWEKKQRDLVSVFVDYNLNALSNLISENIVDLKPEYQRRFRWDKKKQSKLIESFLMNVPIPSIFLNEDDYGKYSVIDGKQRLTAVHDFLTNKLKLEGLEVFSELNGMYYYDLNVSYQNVLKTRAILRAIIILRQSDENIKYEVFRRLNTGGVSLNKQEIRNSAFPGPFNNLILKLSEDKLFQRLLRIFDIKKSRLYKEMKDAELVLRFFTFMDNVGHFSGNISRKMDQFMNKHQKFSNDKINEFIKKFSQTINLVQYIFGDTAFRRFDIKKNNWMNRISVPLYDAQMFSCYHFINGSIKDSFDRNKFSESYRALFNNEDFQESITYHTNSSTNFRIRVDMVNGLINNTVRENPE